MKAITLKKIVGSLMFAMITTRPNLVTLVGIVSKYMHNLTLAHWRAMKQIFRYLQHTRDYWLQYSRKEMILSGFYNADWGGNLNTRKSTIGFAFI
jgi:hypothetical protein